MADLVVGRSDGVAYPNNNLTYKNLNKKQPYQCPICLGCGNVQGGFYNQMGGGRWDTTTITTEKCRSCNGKGIIWG